MRITIVGGGNIGTQFAVHCAEKGHDVTIYTSSPELYDGHISIVDDTGIITHEGDIKAATSNPEKAFKDAELIMVTMPPTLMKTVADMVFAYANINSIIGVVPGNGGSECAFKKCIERGNVFFGIERVPAIARLVQKGKIVKSTGYREELHVAALPRENAESCAEVIQSIFDIRTTVIPNYLNLTMTPSNPILHTVRLKKIFENWHEGLVLKSVPLFYEEWDDASSDLLIACDKEVQLICKAFPKLQLQYVKSLRDHYESPSVKAMTKKITSIPAFRGLKTPTIEVEGGVIPDLHSRYFTSDFSYGLSIIIQVADFAGLDTPTLRSVMEWYREIAIEKGEFRFENYGIINKDNFIKFYLL